jgi:hypothetical protein
MKDGMQLQNGQTFSIKKLE